MNIRKSINKLQKALIQRGYIYKINTYQFYSDQQNRMITGCRITQKQPYRKKNGEMSVKDVELFNSCSQVEVLKWFVGEWEKRKNETD
jgi:methionyl-tRNA synthetase